MKKKLIATAVAGALVSPIVMADSEVTPYFRINNALELRDTDGADSTADLRNVSSRIGIRGSHDLGNGTTVFGQYEFSTFTDREGTVGGRGGINDTRIGIVGMRGSFGSISAGNQWSAFFNHIGTHLDPTYTLGYVLYSSQMGGPYRESNAVKYSNSLGAVSFEVDARFSTDASAGPGTPDVEKIGGDNGEDFLDGFGVGVTFGVTDAITLAAAYDSELFAVGDNIDRLGVAAKASFGAFWASVAFMDVSQDSAGTDNQLLGIYGGTTFGEYTTAMVGFLSGDNGTTEPNQIILHANHKIGGGPLRVYYEGTFVDFDGAAADFNTHLVGMRIDL